MEGPSLRLLRPLTERLLQDLLTRALLFITLIQHSSLIVGDHYQGKAGQGNNRMGSFCSDLQTKNGHGHKTNTCSNFKVSVRTSSRGRC